MAVEIDDALAQYLAARWTAEGRRVASVISVMRAREVRLVREAAIMGYVRGAMAGESAVFNGGRLFSTQIPDGKDILATVISACLSMPDLYPTFERMERTAMRREATS